MTDLTAVSLFAGVGGFDLALQQNGVKVVAAVEIDKEARGVLAKRFPETSIFQDVREITGDQLRAAGFVPERGIITGGFPCQDLSVAGKRAGLGGQRSGLFWHIIRLVKELEPKWLILENVPGLLSSNDGRDMGTVLGALAGCGYGVAYRVLDAQFFGVPQRRRRVFIVCCRGDSGRTPAAVLAVAEAMRDYAEKSERSGSSNTNSPRSSTRRSGKSVGSLSDSEPTLFDITDYDERFSQIDTTSSVLVNPTHDEREEDQFDDDFDETSIDETTDGILTALAFEPGAMSRMPHRSFAKVTPTLLAAARDSQPAVYIKQVNPLDDGDTFTKAKTVNVVRMLTPMECERLQGFPDGWTNERIDPDKGLVQQTITARWKQMGNAIAVPCVSWIVENLIAND